MDINPCRDLKSFNCHDRLCSLRSSVTPYSGGGWEMGP